MSHRKSAAREVVIAQYDTGKFDFLCAADTREQAITLLRKAWRIHCDKTGADPAYFVPDDVWITRISTGQVMRDETRII